jgi:hypothetical protein
MISYDDSDLGIKEPSRASVPLSLVEGTDLYSLYSTASGDLYKSSGYGVHIYDKLIQTTGTSTFDELNYGPTSSSGYRRGPSEDKSGDGGTEQKKSIIKFYAKKNADGTYQYIENFTRQNTISPIEIEDEVGYVIEDWFTSPTLKVPANKTDSYFEYKNSLSNKATGKTTGSVDLENNENLYVLLVEQVKVIKVYETSGTVDKIVVEIPNIQNNTYTVVTPDNGYEYKEGTTSENGYTSISRWDEAPKTNSTTSTSISVPDEIKTIYLHYTKDPLSGGLVLHENEISHNFTSLGLVDGTLHEAIRQYNSVSAPSCPYFYYDGCGDEDDDCPGHTCGETMNQTDAGTYSFTIDNKAVYNKQFVYKWNQLTSAFSGEGPGENGGTRSGKPDMEMTLSRVGSGDIDGVTTVFCSLFYWERTCGRCAVYVYEKFYNFYKSQRHFPCNITSCSYVLPALESLHFERGENKRYGIERIRSL